MVAIGIGVAIAMLGHFKHLKILFTSKIGHEIVPISETQFYPKDREIEELGKTKVSVLRPKGPMFFGSVEGLLGSYLNASKHQVLIVDMDGVEMMDLTGMYALEDLLKSLKLKNIDVYISKTHTHLTMALEKIGFFDSVGRDHYGLDKDSILPAILDSHN